MAWVWLGQAVQGPEAVGACLHRSHPSYRAPFNISRRLHRPDATRERGRGLEGWNRGREVRACILDLVSDICFTQGQKILSICLHMKCSDVLHKSGVAHVICRMMHAMPEAPWKAGSHPTIATKLPDCGAAHHRTRLQQDPRNGTKQQNGNMPTPLR